MNPKISTLQLFVAVMYVTSIYAFIPAEMVEEFFKTFGDNYIKPEDIFTETISHDEIIRKGIIRSVVRYFYNQPNGASNLNLSKIDTEYYQIANLYYDYYGVWLCDTNLEGLLSREFEPDVASVDLSSKTKDLPYAHFDAETFRESNARVMNFTQAIYAYLNDGNYKAARENSGKILHTIQDFYSHSNWVEKGENDINKLIGTPEFDKLKIIDKSEKNPCISNCTMVSIDCSSIIQAVYKFFTEFGFKILECPLTYYKCNGNILILNELVSGYYSGQKLEDGTPVPKPDNIGKCSHGGMLDSTANAEAKGGINKDTGMYILSPHANLHDKAVNLAILHTEYFFNQIRSKIGDDNFAEFLELKVPNKTLEDARNKNLTTCGSEFIHNSQYIYFTTFLLTMTFWVINLY